MERLLRRIAGHKYSWSYIGRYQLPTADALVRRGLARYGESHGRDHYDCPEVVATDEGRAEIERRWPNCPSARGTYESATESRGCS
jgi:hypothetical protein